MTPGNGLSTWERIGGLERELRPYREYLRRGWDVTLATYDRQRQPLLGQAEFSTVRCPHRRLLPLLPVCPAGRALRRVQVVKTNQSVCAWWYVLAAKFWRKPILLRCGYVAGESLETTVGRTLRTGLYQRREAWAFRNATMCSVPTPALKRWVCDRYRVPEQRVAVVPNFVDTSLFHPDCKSIPVERSVICVGNISAVKNPELLVRASAGAGAAVLTLVGSGPAEGAVTRLAGELGLRVELLGRVANPDLPAVLHKHAVYVQASRREGQCKAMMEAMACGLACVGTDVPGTRDSLCHEQTGLLSPAEPEPLAFAIRRLFEDGDLWRRLGANAAASVHSEYAFERVFEREYSIVSALAGLS